MLLARRGCAQALQAAALSKSSHTGRPTDRPIEKDCDTGLFLRAHCQARSYRNRTRHERASKSAPDVKYGVQPWLAALDGGIKTHIFFSQLTPVRTPDCKAWARLVNYQKNAGKLVKPEGNDVPVSGEVVFGKWVSVARPIALPDWIKAGRARPGPILHRLVKFLPLWHSSAVVLGV